MPWTNVPYLCHLPKEQHILLDVNLTEGAWQNPTNIPVFEHSEILQFVYHIIELAYCTINPMKCVFVKHIFLDIIGLCAVLETNLKD